MSLVKKLHNLGYNKKIRSYFLGDPVNVSVSIQLLKLVDINEADCSIEISLLWKDKRVTFHSLKLSHSLNVLSEDSSHMKTSKN